jgi:hypothetical protein
MKRKNKSGSKKKSNENYLWFGLATFLVLVIVFLFFAGTFDNLLGSSDDVIVINNDSSLTLDENITRDYYYVFVTSNTYDGASGGVDGLNEKCSFSAQVAGLDNDYMAIIQDDFAFNQELRLLNDNLVSNDFLTPSLTTQTPKGVV